MKKTLHFLWVCFFLFIATGMAIAQQSTINGKVTDVSGAPLAGVTVSVKGTANGTITGANGTYSLTGVSKNVVLAYSFIGLKTHEVTFTSQTEINVTLEEETIGLDEVVAIGYGTQRKSDLTGSVSVVNTDEAKKTITYDVAKMLQGKASGVSVQSSGEPGGFVNIKIRGITSFNNNNPLFVIDGMIVDAPNDFAPGEIESVQILKDASAAAIYGVRGANGVVIITTNKGKEGEMAINLKSVYGFQTVPKKLPLTDRIGYQKITSAAEVNAGLAIVPGNDPTNPLYIDDVNTNWQDEAYRTGIVENHAVTLSGGAKSLTYSLNLDYFNNSSYIKTPQDYNRISTTLNLGGQKGKFKYGAKVGYTKSEKDNFNVYLAGTSSMVHLVQAIPTMPVYDENRLGGYGGADNLTQRAITLNIIGHNYLNQNTSDRNRFIGNVWGELEIVKGLKYKTSASIDRIDAYSRNFVPPSDLGWYYITTNEEASLDVANSNTYRTVLDNLLSYDHVYGKHSVSALVGWVQERSDFYNHWSRGVGYQPAEIGHVEYADDISAGEYENTITGISYLSRLNYGFDDRYLATINYRRDKSSLFNPENNTGDYFSVSGAWKIHNESFIDLPVWMNTLKLRGGYGQLGNNTIGVYDYAATINPFAHYVFGNTLAPGTTAVDIKDPNVKWEDTETINVALEFGLFSNSLQFSAEYFKKKSTDLLADVPLPFSTGAFPANITTNAADIQNTGLEFELSYSKSKGDFSYNISANLGTLKNKVLKIGADDLPITGAASRTEVGRSIGEIYAYEVEGIFQNQAEVTAHAFQSGAAPGDIKFRNTNTDNEITSDDRTFQGVTIPKFSYGLNFSSNYKNWDFSFFWQGAAGHKVFNDSYRIIMLGDYTNHHTDALNFWTTTNTNTNVPRPIIGDPNGNNRDSDRYIEKGDFIKLQNVQLGYTFNMTNSIFKNANVYISGQNLLTISGYRGYDPDFMSDGLFSRGFDRGSFPNPRTVAIGVNVNF